MLGNSFIDMAIGVVLMYLVLSVVCTAVNEALATVFKWRAKTLAAGVRALVDDPAVYALLFDHGVLAGPSAVAQQRGIPAFLGRLLGWLHDPGPSYIDSRNFAVALLDCLDPDKPLPGISDVKRAASDLQAPSNIKDVLLTVTTRAGDDITKARDDLARWFDTAMDRLSGVYKRKLQLWGFIVAALLTAALNADTVTVARALWLDAGLRDQVAALASTSVASAPQSGNSSIGDLAHRAEQNVQDLEAVRAFPLGWTGSLGRPDKGWNETLAGWCMKVLGLAITAFALTLGAPFWFDALSSFVRLRGSGEPPTPSTAAATPPQFHINVPPSA
ncbi:MAG TPA: hypothetical protein VN823_16415 [Stellaceae bacterium]|nr:hypothetical protein [Stellaceae bacterium]